MLLCFCLLVCLFFAILLSKSLILALGYGTDCTQPSQSSICGCANQMSWVQFLVVCWPFHFPLFCIRLKETCLTWHNHCLWRLSPVISYCAVVCPYNVTLIQWWVYGEHCLVGTCNRMNDTLGLLISSIESYHNPIPPPGDSGSRSTSGGAGEGPGLVIVS